MAPKRSKSNTKSKQAKEQNMNESNSGLEDIQNSNTKQNNAKLETNAKFLALPKLDFTQKEQSMSLMTSMKTLPSMTSNSTNVSNEDSVKQMGLTSKGSPNSGFESLKTSNDQFFKELLFRSKGTTNKTQKQNPMRIQMEAKFEGMENELMELMGMPLFMPPPPILPPHPFEAVSESMCSEIVDQLRQTTNQLVEEIRESRKAAKDCTEESTKRMIDSLKQMQSDFKQTFGEELKKLLNK